MGNARNSPRRARCSPKHSDSISTLGEAFTKGLIELVVSAQTDTLLLAYFDGKKLRYGSRISTRNNTYVPGELDPSILMAMRLPQKAAAYGSAAQLLTEISMLLSRYSGLDDQRARLVAFFSLASWVSEGLPRVPQLRIVGPSCIESSQLMRLMGCLCRHAFELTEVDVAGLFSLPLNMNPSLLIKQPQLKGPVLRLLNAVSEGGLHIRRGRLFDFHVPVATFSQSITEIPVTGAVVEIPITPTNQPLPALDERTEREIAREFQDKLFGFRVDWLNKVNTCAFDAPELAFPMRQVARSFGACVPDEPSLQSELVATLKDGDASDRLERSTSLEATVVEALLFFAHDAERRNAVHVGEITTAVNEIRKGRGVTETIEPRKVGGILRTLGFRTKNIDSSGRGVLLADGVRQSAHRLAWDLKVPSVRNSAALCDLCKQFAETGRPTQ